MKPQLWLIKFIGVIVPRRLRADWRQEWEAELHYRETLLAEWDRLNWRSKLDLLRRSIGAFRDALLLQPRRLEGEMLQDIRYGLRMLLKTPGFALAGAAFFGLLALSLACVGLYGVLSYAVARRTNEIGIRMALGARRLDVLWLVLRELLALVCAGAIIGLLASLAATRTASTLLFGVKPGDLLTTAAATLLLLAVAALAGYLPARRATKVDPMAALRYE